MSKARPIVTGGAGGIGGATGYRARPWRCIRHSCRCRSDGARRSAHAVSDAGANVRTVVADVSRSDDVRAFVDARAFRLRHDRCPVQQRRDRRCGRLNTVEYPVDVFDRVIAINLRGVFLGLKHVLPVMVEQGGGSMINTSSMAGERGLPGSAAYNASKHGVVGLTVDRHRGRIPDEGRPCQCDLPRHDRHDDVPLGRDDRSRLTIRWPP